MLKGALSRATIPRENFEAIRKDLMGSQQLERLRNALDHPRFKKTLDA